MNHSTSWGPGQMFWGVPGYQGESWITAFTEHQNYFRTEETGLDGYKLPEILTAITHVLFSITKKDIKISIYKADICKMPPMSD